MKKMPVMVLLMILFGVLVIHTVSTAQQVLGHGLGSEILPTKNVRDRQVFIEIHAVNLPQEPVIDQQFTFRFLDAETNQPIQKVTFEVQCFKQGMLLFNETFEVGSGVQIFNFIDNKEIRIEKESKEIFDFFTNKKDVINVYGPYFDYGGLYQFNIKVHTIDSYSNKLDTALVWDAGISLSDTTQHSINDLNFGLQTIQHITYYDLIDNLGYNQRTKQISFDMPFDSIEQTSVIHHEVVISKNFGDLMASEIIAKINGVQMPDKVITIDDFTESQRIIHLTASQNNIVEIQQQGKVIQDDKLHFVIGPPLSITSTAGQQVSPLSIITKNGEFKIIMNTDPAVNIKAGEELTIHYKVFDVFLEDAPISVEHDVRVIQGDNILFEMQDTSNDDAQKFDSVTFDIPNQVTGVIYVHFENLGGNSLASAKLPIVVDRIFSNIDDAHVPDLWVSKDRISDQEFARGIQYLIRENSILIPSALSAPLFSWLNENNLEEQTNDRIADWIKNNAVLWSKNIISNKEFIAGIEYAIQYRILT